eukprot:m.898985 g.898985  ORF g.898985 m.898985 type:complete len:797 (+) comp23676_c0_seq11:175-2565(+)
MSKPPAPPPTSVRVIVRCRPMNSTEKKQNCQRCVEMDPSMGSCSTVDKGGDKKSFTYDAVYDWNSKQKDIYDESVRPIVNDVLNGYNGTIFAYGQTGTGKTFTMEGVKNDPMLKGVIPNSFEHIFSEISRTQGKQFLVRASYLEIYSEDIRDLISSKHTQRLQLREKDSGVYVEGLTSAVVKNIQEIENVMSIGNANRSVGRTNMNEHSSRSHAIFIITVECSETGIDGENHIRVGKLNLVDLAGSERQKKTQAEGQRLQEGIKINLSLSCLGNVINGLVEGKGRGHIPYRNSQLTRLLQDSLGGNSKTVMIANIGPADYNADETINTLRYANRAKNIKNKPKINEDPKDAMLRAYQDTLNKLKAKLEARGGGKSKKKKRRRNRKPRFDEAGNELPPLSDDSDDGGEDDVNPAEQARQEKEFLDGKRAELEAERQEMMANVSLTKQEREDILQNIQQREQQLEQEEKAKAEIAAQIKYMEGKLLIGGKNVIDHTSAQEKELERRRLEMLEAKAREREMLQKLQEQEAKKAEAEETFSSKQQEAAHKTKKLNKLFKNFKETKREIGELQAEFAQEREELSQTLAELQRDLKLRELIIEHFIPPDTAGRLHQRTTYDADEDRWSLVPTGHTATEPANASGVPPVERPVSAFLGTRQAVCEFARVRAAIDRNPRYRHENIYLVELDMPERTTQDYFRPDVDPHLSAALEDALKDEEEMTVDANPQDFLTNAIKKAQKNQRRQRKLHRESGTVPSARPPQSTQRQQQRLRSRTASAGSASSASNAVPESRGLVQRRARFA